MNERMNLAASHQRSVHVRPVYKEQLPLLPTVSWSLIKVVVSCVLPHQGRVLSDDLTATMEKDVLQLQV